MAAWGPDAFSNDDALDWLIDFTEAPTMEMLRDTLELITLGGNDEEPDEPDCAEAIAAAEIVAALAGSPSADLPDDLKAWLESDHGLSAGGLKAKALAAVERIARASELKDLWDESDLREQWQAQMANLARRLH
jgi:Domain of unknown function (DUF4259)